MLVRKGYLESGQLFWMRQLNEHSLMIFEYLENDCEGVIHVFSVVELLMNEKVR